jgi:hypothetical protein
VCVSVCLFGFAGGVLVLALVWDLGLYFDLDFDMDLDSEFILDFD